MKTIITKGGQYFEIWESRKEALKDVVENIMWLDDTEYWDGDSTLYIGYKDGTYFYVDDCGNREGKFKKTGITSIIFSNGCTTAVDGEYESTTLMMLTKSTARKTTAKKKSGTSHKLSSNLQSDRRKAGNAAVRSQAQIMNINLQIIQNIM